MRFVVDGHTHANPESDFQGDGQFPPFVIFDITAQENLPGEYRTRADAETVLRLLPD